MKKLIAALTLMLLFSISANAQAKSEATNGTKGTRKEATKEVKVATKEATKDVKEVTENFDPVLASKKDAKELTNFLSLNETENANFQRLFEMKHNTLQDKNLSQERRTEMSRIMEAKIRATLNEKQMIMLESNPELFKKLIN